MLYVHYGDCSVGYWEYDAKTVFISILTIVTTATLFSRKTVGDVVISILNVLTIEMLFPRLQLMLYEYGVP